MAAVAGEVTVSGKVMLVYVSLLAGLTQRQAKHMPTYESSYGYSKKFASNETLHETPIFHWNEKHKTRPMISFISQVPFRPPSRRSLYPSPRGRGRYS